MKEEKKVSQPVEKETSVVVEQKASLTEIRAAVLSFVSKDVNVLQSSGLTNTTVYARKTNKLAGYDFYWVNERRAWRAEKYVASSSGIELERIRWVPETRIDFYEDWTD